MKISVVIPLYNKASHIKRAIDSVLRQTYTDFELIVVDDGSTDSSAAVVKEIEDSRLRLVQQVNAGECAARNRGIMEATGEFAAFLDADDEWLPDFLGTVIYLCGQFPQAAVFGTAYVLIDNNGRAINRKFDVNIIEGDETACLLNYFAGGKKGYFGPLCSSSIMVRKNAMTAIGSFPVGLIFGGDIDTWMRLALRYSIAWTSHPMAIVHEDAENRISDLWPVGVLPFFVSLRTYIHEIGDERRIPLQVYQYFAGQHTSHFWQNMVAGDREAVREIACDCWAITGYRLCSLFWYVLSLLPTAFVRWVWRCNRILRGYSSETPKFQSVYRK